MYLARLRVAAGAGSVVVAINSLHIINRDGFRPVEQRFRRSGPRTPAAIAPPPAAPPPASAGAISQGPVV